MVVILILNHMAMRKEQIGGIDLKCETGKSKENCPDVW